MSDSAQPALSSEKRRFATNTILNGVSQFASLLSSLIFMPLLVDSFGITHYGLFMIASSVTAYAALADFGVGTALTKMVAERSAVQDRGGMRRLVAGALLFYLGVGALVAIVVLAIALLSSAIFHVDLGDAQVLRNMLILSAIFQLIYWPMSTARHVLAGLQRYDLLARVSLLSVALSVGAALAVIVTGEGPLLLLGLNGATMTLVAMITAGIALRVSGLQRPTLAGAATYLGAMLSFSGAVFVVQLSDALFYSQTDRMILGVLAGAAAVGLYEAAAKFGALVTYASSLTVSAVLPLASSMHAQGRTASLRSLFLRGSKYIAVLVTPVALTLVILAEPIIRAWLGEEFAGQGVTAAVLVLPHVLICLGLMGDSIVISRGRIGARVPYILGQALLNVALSIALVGRYGVLGVAVGTAVAHLVDFPLHIRFLLAETGVTLGEWLKRVIVPVYPQLLLVLGLGAALQATPLADSLPGLFVAAAVMVIAYWLAVYASGLGADERDELRRFAGALVQARPTKGV